VEFAQPRGPFAHTPRHRSHHTAHAAVARAMHTTPQAHDGPGERWTMPTASKRIVKRIDIKAPVADVFAFVTNPNNLPEVWPSLVEVTNAQHRPDGSHSFDFTYKMAGIRLHGHSATEKVEKNARVTTRTTGGIPSTFDYVYEAVGKNTRLTLTVDYTIPGAVLGKLADPIVHRLNEHEADVFLQNLKTRLELARPSTDARPSAE
jgi:uncharacterized protein YndB with AHSA1/START domain